MHDEMHWMATDPYDMQVDEWRRDVTRYAWACQVSTLLLYYLFEGRVLYLQNHTGGTLSSRVRVLALRYVLCHIRHKTETSVEF